MNGLQYKFQIPANCETEGTKKHIMLRVNATCNKMYQVGVVQVPNFIALIHCSYLIFFVDHVLLNCLPCLQLTCFLNLFQLNKTQPQIL